MRQKLQQYMQWNDVSDGNIDIVCELSSSGVSGITSTSSTSTTSTKTKDGCD